MNRLGVPYKTTPADRAAREARKAELEEKQNNNTITKDETDELNSITSGIEQMNINRGGRRRRRTNKRRRTFRKKRSSKRRRR